MYVVNLSVESTILDSIYPKPQIFIERAEFLPENKPLVIVTCLVPVTDSYAIKLVPYVTTENYVRCLSQATYLLAEHVLRRKILSVDVSVEAFLTAAANYELYYRHLAMTFHARVSKNERFVLRLSIKNAQEIRRLGQDLILFTFTNEKTVISGEMSFVYVR